MKNMELKRKMKQEREQGISVGKMEVIGGMDLWEKKRKVAGTAVLAMGMAFILSSVGFCLPSVNLASSVDNLMNLIFGVLLLIGLFMIITGVYAVVGALRDTEGGHDQGAVGKGIGKALTGLVMAAGPSVISLIIGLDPLHIGTSIFGG